ncbi:sensor domain-containing diguanylate cyclase [Vallicoccus soli]|uniref:Sensor domain-containing diguanylate cyclase n=1 Tax=Vallicoccus soli TaxID=2339232 RepID=A0A3A3YSV8_9ACTN|nr:sensor domain-containing diguanylate cyclase [Vallicoccus soli]
MHDAVGCLGTAIVATTTALVCVIGERGEIVLLNPALERATGWSTAEVAGRPFVDVLAVPHERHLAADAIARALATGDAPPQEGDWLDRWGGHRRVAMQNSVLRDARGRPRAMVCVGADVSAQRAAEALLRERAESDVLTGLRNRAALLRALEEGLACGAGATVLFCDLDGFKAANDTHGHHVGDALLRDVARRLLDATTPQDLVARYGGDEFVVLRPGADEAGASALRDRLEAALEPPHATTHGLVRLGASIGVAIGGAGAAAEELLAAADRHMYGVKTHRRRRGDRRAA